MNDTTVTSAPEGGFLLLNKPATWTSSDCVSFLKKRFGKKAKIGHSGTLDRFATGLLIICFGRQATKKVAELMDCDKTYQVTARHFKVSSVLHKNEKRGLTALRAGIAAISAIPLSKSSCSSSFLISILS